MAQRAARMERLRANIESRAFLDAQEKIRRAEEAQGLLPAPLEPLPVEQWEQRMLTADEARGFLDAIRGDRLEALFSVALALGLRQGEALGLRWQDIELEAGTLAVRTTLQRTDGRYELAEPETEKSRRTLPLPPPVVERLREHRRRQNEERLHAGPLWQDWDLVFSRDDGSPLDRAAVSRHLRTIVIAADLPPVRFHDLRHSCASLLLAQGVSMKVIQETLGHSSIATTGNIYAHVIPELQSEAAAKMAAVFEGNVIWWLAFWLA